MDEQLGPVRWISGPFTVSHFDRFLTPYAVWLTNDPEKKIVFTADNARQLENYFQACCDRITNSSKGPAPV